MKQCEKCGIYGKVRKCEKYENGSNFIKIPLDFIRVFAFGAFLVDFPKILSILNVFYENLVKSYIFCENYIFVKFM